jgi:hypothetical protein
MNENAELLNYIYQNAQMGVITTDQLIYIAEDDDFKAVLAAHLEEYRSIFSEAREQLNRNGYDEKGISTCSKIKTYICVRLQTAKDHTPSHVAEMLILGSIMGILDATKNLKKYQDADEEIRNLMQRLLAFEEDNAQQLKDFL